MSNGGYLAGGYSQRYNNLESTGIPLIEGQWGLVTGDLGLVGQGLLPKEAPPDYLGYDRVLYSWLFFTDQSAAVGALRIVGGRQIFLEGNTPAENFVWGNRAPYEQEVYSSQAYDNHTSSWTLSSIRLYVTAANNNQIPGFRIVGVRQLSRDEESKQPYVTISEWGDTSAQEQFIGIGKSWSQPYAWGLSQISLFLASA